MKRLLVLITLSALVVASAALAQDLLPAKMRPAKAAERQAAMTSIQAQLKAFGRDDYKTAASYQSAGLRQNFASVNDFRTMMVRTYPEFAHFKTVTFGSAQSDPTGAHLAILAAVTGRNGITRHALYLMVREGKLYRVAGVAGGAQMPLENSGPSRDV